MPLLRKIIKPTKLALWTYFLDSVAEHSKELPHDNGDVLSPNDYEKELNGSPFKVIDEHYGSEYRGKGIWGHYFRMSHALACRHFCNRSCSRVYHPGGTPVQPCVHPHAKYHLSEEKLILEIVKRSLSRGARCLPPPIALWFIGQGILGTFMMTLKFRSPMMSHDERRAAMERLDIIKNAKGPMLRSQLVAQVCAALLAAGSTKGYTFHKSSDAPGPSSSSSKDPAPSQGTTIRDRTVNRSQGHLSVCVLNLGNWERSRKRSTPQCFHHLLDWIGTCQEHKRDPTCGNLFLHFLSNISSHVLILQEASSIRHLEKSVLKSVDG